MAGGDGVGGDGRVVDMATCAFGFPGVEMSAVNSTLSVKEWNYGFLHGAFFPTTTKSLAAGAAARGVSSTQARRAQMRGIAPVPFFEGSECFEP